MDLNRLNEEGHDGQKIPLPRRGAIPFSSEIDMDSVKEAIYARLGSLLKLCPKRKKGYRLVVLVALDEAQFLDRLIHPDAEGGGARYGFACVAAAAGSCLRSDQTAVPLAPDRDRHTPNRVSFVTDGR